MIMYHGQTDVGKRQTLNEDTAGGRDNISMTLVRYTA